MNAALLRAYRKFRGQGCFVGRDAEYALKAARTLLLWERLESVGLVSLEAVPDESYDWTDEDPKIVKRYGSDGAWGSVGKYRTSEDSKWEHGDSVWGHVGYRDVLSPTENVYIVDIMIGTIAELRKTLQSRCTLCRQPLPHSQ